MAHFLVEVATEAAWAVPVAIVLWISARQLTVVRTAEMTTGLHDAAKRPAWQRAIGLVAVAVILWMLMVGLGWLITSALTPVRDLDVAVVEWFEENRTEPATFLARAIDPIGNTPGIIAMVLIAATVAHALTRRWGPTLVIIAAAVGETTIFLATQLTIRRARPAVEFLAGEPATSSFPSGHVAATIATYGCIALLVRSWSSTRWRVVAVVASVALAVAMAWARLYQGLHFPSDVLGSVMFAPLWLTACWWAFRPQPRDESVRFKGAAHSDAQPLP